MKNLLPLLFVLTFIQGISAQVAITDTERHASAALGETLDAKEIANRFGTPESQETFLDDFDNRVDAYCYPGLEFECVDAKLYNFRVLNSRYEIVLLNRHVIHIGDNWDEIFRKLPSTLKAVTESLTPTSVVMRFPNDEMLGLTINDSGLIEIICWYVII